MSDDTRQPSARAAGNYHVIQGGTWKVAKWEPSRLVAAITGHWYIAGYRRSFLDGELDRVGPRILPPDLEDDGAQALAREVERRREAEWQSIETAPWGGVICDFWLEWADQVPFWRRSQGLSTLRDHLYRGTCLEWPAIYRATHWRALPEPPTDAR